MTERRYPSKNCIRLTAEVEQLTGGMCEWEFEGDEELCLRIDKIGYSNHVPLLEGDCSDVDAAQRRLLVLARREFS